MKKLVTLGPLEREVMQCLWNHDETTVRQIVDCLSKKKSIAYTTVMTILDRLHSKRIVSRKKVSKAYVYTPRLSKKQVVQNIINQTLKSLSKGYGTEATTAFARGIRELPQQEREQILNLLNEDEKR